MPRSTDEPRLIEKTRLKGERMHWTKLTKITRKHLNSLWRKPGVARPTGVEPVFAT